MSNQYIKAAEQGSEPPKGSNQFTTGKRTHADERTRDKMRAERAAQVLENILESDEASIEQRIAAGKALIPYGKATCQENIDLPSETRPEAELIEELRALFFSKPELLSQLGLTFKPGRGPEQPQSDVSDPQQRSAA